MDELQTLYRKIESLRNQGCKMKEIADWTGMAPSVLSSLYTTVLPDYFEHLKSKPADEALDHAITLVNNISKRRLLASLPGMLKQLDELEPAADKQPPYNPFATQLLEEMRQSVRKINDISGIYISYSLSSSSDSLKQEPFLIAPSENRESVRIGRLSAYGESQWGFGIMGDPQNFYCLFNETQAPHFTPVTVYLQVPLFPHPKQLRGLYIGLDYNRNPVARRLLLIKESESTDPEDFKNMPSGVITKDKFTPEQEAYYQYTCQTGDFIKMCTVPSLQMDTSDLVKEKRMLEL